MTWARFERFSLDGPRQEWIDFLFWPQFLAEMAFLIAAPIKESYERYLAECERLESER